jgi:N-acetylglucosamine-6-phosphate deacetylase
MGLSLADALRMATLTPATLLGVSERKGSLEVGKDADVVILDDELRVVHSVVAGKIVDTGSEVCLEEGGEFGWMMTL